MLKVNELGINSTSENIPPVDGGGRETAEVAAGLRAAPELDGAAGREEDAEEESGMVTAGALQKALGDSKAALPSVAGNAERTFHQKRRSKYNVCTQNRPEKIAGVKPAPGEGQF
jgi:hypothetical protein